MKHFLVSVGIMLTEGLSFAQSDGINRNTGNSGPISTKILWNHPLVEGEGVLQIQQSDGRIVLTKKINTNESTGITLRVSDWNPGIYQIKYRSSKGTVSTAQLVVQ